MARRAALPSLKHWIHNVDWKQYETYHITMSPDGKVVQHRGNSRAVPKWGDLQYQLTKWEGKWFAEVSTHDRTDGVDEDGNVYHGIAAGNDRRFSSAAKARAAANKHWQRGA